MGRKKEFTEEDTSAASVSLSQALLFTTICIIGFPVEVHIKDGSVFSGIFYTASVDNGYGIALKKARMIKKGTHNANFPNGGLVNTLVVFPEDLVQVVAKGVMLPAHSVSIAATCDDGEAVSGTSNSFEGSDNGALGGGQWNLERQVGVDSLQDEDGYCHHSESMKGILEVHGSNTSVNGCCTEVKVREESHTMVASNQLENRSPSASDTALNVKLMNQFHDSQLSKQFMLTESVGSEVSGSVKAESDASRGYLVVPAETSPQNPLANRTSRESKLNPGAKVFTPSIASLRTPPPMVPTVQSMGYVTNSIPAMQVAAAQPEVGIRPIAPRSSWPLKVVPYVNPAPINADNSLQYSQPRVAGHITTRAQPIRHGAQYQPIQALPPYLHTNPQNAMFGRQSQVVFVHPVTHDVIQGPAGLSQAPHPILTSHQIHVTKHEGIRK